MALSKTHILLTDLAISHSGAPFSHELLAYSVLPDAIRCFNFGDEVENTRVVSHFEVNPVTGVASGMVFPTPDELKILNDEIVQKKIVHIEKDYNQVAIGDTTNLGAYIQLNSNRLPELEYKGILNHLLQDSLYDNHVRTLIDCTNRPNGEFTYTVTGEKFDATSVCKLISDIEQQEFRYLSTIFEDETGFTPQEYFETIVFPSIRDVFCTKMAETTIKYINLDDNGIEVAPNEVCKKIIDDMIQASTSIW